MQTFLNYLGWLDEEGTARALCSAHVVIVPSRWEGFAMVPLEAMSYGVPVIASDCTSLPEVVSDGYNGLLFPSGDGAALARRIRSRTPREWRAMGQNALLQHRKRFGGERMARAIAAVYFDVTGRQPPADVAAGRDRDAR